MYDCFLLLVGGLLSTTLCKLAPSSAIVGMRRITTSSQATEEVRERSLGWQVGCVLFEDSCSQSNYIRWQLWRMREFRVRRTVGSLVRTIKCFARSHQRAAEIWETSTTNSWQNSLSAHSSRDIEQPFFPNTQFRNYFSRLSSLVFFLHTFGYESMLRTHSILIIFHENLNSSSNKWMKCEENNKPKNDIGVRRARVQRTKKLFIRKRVFIPCVHFIIILKYSCNHF